MIARRHALRAAIIIQGMGIVKGIRCDSLSTMLVTMWINGQRMIAVYLNIQIFECSGYGIL